MSHAALETSLTVQKALRVIRAFSAAGPTLAVSEIAQRLEIPRSTASRLVAALCQDGYLSKTPAGTYVLGLKFVGYASVAVSSNGIRAFARPELLELRQSLGLSTHLSLFDRDRDTIVHIERLRAGELERFPIYPNDRVPVHATSSGKAHLAFCDGETIERFTSAHLHRFTKLTVVNQPRLKRELHAVRENGFAVGCDEFIIGVSSVAAPIFGPDGRVVAAMSITGLTHQLNDRFRRHAVERLNGAVNRIGAQLRSAALKP